MKNVKLKVDINDRAYDFALRVVKFVKTFPKETAGFELGKQLLKAGTSIAANIEEAQAAFSKEDFIYKMSLSLKEARETNFWLRIVEDSHLVKEITETNWLLKESEEIKKILGSIVKSSRESLDK